MFYKIILAALVGTSGCVSDVFHGDFAVGWNSGIYSINNISSSWGSSPIAWGYKVSAKFRYANDLSKFTGFVNIVSGVMYKYGVFYGPYEDDYNKSKEKLQEISNSSQDCVMEFLNGSLLVSHSTLSIGIGRTTLRKSTCKLTSYLYASSVSVSTVFCNDLGGKRAIRKDSDSFVHVRNFPAIHTTCDFICFGVALSIKGDFRGLKIYWFGMLPISSNLANVSYSFSSSETPIRSEWNEVLNSRILIVDQEILFLKKNRLGFMGISFGLKQSYWRRRDIKETLGNQPWWWENGYSDNCPSVHYVYKNKGGIYIPELIVSVQLIYSNYVI